MSRKARWIRLRPGRRETVGAALASGAVAACVGAVTFYLARLFLSREPIGPAEPDDSTDE